MGLVACSVWGIIGAGGLTCVVVSMRPPKTTAAANTSIAHKASAVRRARVAKGIKA
jgi:hypothetical protein